jgi:Protein of unknown function (DUF3072)
VHWKDRAWDLPELSEGCRRPRINAFAGKALRPSQRKTEPAVIQRVKSEQAENEKLMPARSRPAPDENPKIHPDPASNTEKDPDDWVSGDDPMTGAQASYLKTLSEQAHDPNAFEEALSKAEASKRIDALKKRLGQKQRA